MTSFHMLEHIASQPCFLHAGGLFDSRVQQHIFLDLSCFLIAFIGVLVT